MRSLLRLGLGSGVAGLTLLTAALLAGCTEEESAGPKQTSPALTEAGLEAKDCFLSRGYPTMQGACGNCHSGTGGGGTAFLTGNADTSYDKIQGQAGLISEPGRSPLINYIHQSVKVDLAPEVRSILTQWLNLEASARGLTGSIKSALTLSDAYKEFANCMNYSVWDYYRMGDLPFVQTDLEGPCMGCHTTGQAGAWLNADSQFTFEKAKQFPFIQKYVVGKVDGNGHFEKLIPANRFIEKANEICPKEKEDCHPIFGLPPLVQDGLTLFIQTTLQNLAGGTCATGISAVRDAGATTVDGGKDGGN